MMKNRHVPKHPSLTILTAMGRTLMTLLLLLALAIPAQSQTLKPCGTSRIHRHHQPQTARALRPQAQSPAYEGEKRGLIILVEFPDQPFSTDNPQQTWDAIANEEGYSQHNAVGSVSDYFRDQSYGRFRLRFDVVGPVMARNGYAYYGDNKDWGDGDWFDRNVGELVEEACRGVEPQVSFADYDWDGDGEVEEVYILYAGHGENDYWSKDTTVIWPHMACLSTDWEGYDDGLVLQGLRIDTYACSNEISLSGRLAGVGTFCHEFSHCLGLPDLYNTEEGSSVLDKYDVMDQGNYNGNSWCPVGYSSYERYACGWLDPVEVSSLDEVGPLLPLHESPDARLLRLSADADDYYLIENRQQQSWDRYIPTAGLLAWHIDYDEQAWVENTVNNDPDHLRVEHLLVSDIPTGISRVTLGGEEPIAYYDLKGRRLPKKPSEPGLYIAVTKVKQVVLVSLR